MIINGNKRQHAGVLTAAEYAAGSVAGMPQRAKCKKVFTRVEGLKKHIRSGCEGGIAGQSHCEGDVTASVGQVPAERVELPRCRAPQTVLRALPVAEQPVHTVLANSAAFCEHVNTDWRRAAARTEYRQVLKEHCILCGQWRTAEPSPYTSCPVVFQVALMRLLLQPGGPLHTHEDGSGGDGCGRAAGSAGTPGAGGCVRGGEEVGGAILSAERGGTRVSGGGGEATEVEKGRKQRQGTLHFFLGRMGQRQPRKAGMEGGSSCGERREQANPGAAEVPGEDVGETRAGADAHQAGRGLYRFLRHVGAGVCGHAAGGAQDVAAAVSAGAGEDCSEDHPRHVMMKDLRERAEAVLGDGVGAQPCVDLSDLGLEGEEAGALRGRSDQALGGAPLGGPPPGEPSRRGGADEILVPQAPAGEVRCGGHPCDTATEPEGRGERRLPQRAEDTQWQRLHEVAGGTLEAGIQKPPLVMGGRRGSTRSLPWRWPSRKLT